MRPVDRFVRLRGLRFHLLERGRRGARPLLMLHGAAQTAHSFDEVAPPLARARHVVCVDQRGHGDTDWAARYRRDDFAGDVDALLDHLGWDDAAIVAMSLGGLDAIAFAAARPARVRALVLVDVLPSVAPEGREAIARHLAVQDFASFDDAVAMARAFNPRRTPENVRERLGHAMRGFPDGRWRYKFDPGIAEGAADAERLWPALGRVRSPVLLVRGAESALVDDAAVERYRATVPRGREAMVPGAGHSVMGDNPAAFVDAVEPFLSRHGG